MADAATSPRDLDSAALEEVARMVATRAGRLIVDERPADLRVSAKSTRTDPVTVMDRRSQDLILALLAECRPDDAVLGEEDGGVPGSSGVTWIVDPIDGTVNYLYGIPWFAVSVAAVIGDPGTESGWRTLAGAVDNPVSGELFHARLGGGARLTTSAGTTEIAASACPELDLALVGTGFGYAARRRRHQGRVLAGLIGNVRDIRRAGSAALDLCSVAAGRLDGYYETGLGVWDRAAAQLVAAEAGAVVGGPEGAGPNQSLTWAAAPGIADDFAGLVRALTTRHLPNE
jgi:myo-inositol-1(or 4)-monophosphatase